MGSLFLRQEGRKILNRIKIVDVIVFLVFTSALLYGGKAMFFRVKDGEARVVIQGSSGDWIYPLKENHDALSIPGPLGNTVVEIHDHSVQVLSSPCRDKLCMIGDSLVFDGDWTACLPNKVLIRVESLPEEDGIDALSF